jgi:hypothetical protein
MTGKSKRGVDFAALAASQVKRDGAAASRAPDRFERAQSALQGPSYTRELDELVERERSTREAGAAPAYVAQLMESIAVLGLLEPIVVDRHSRLLAGGHRLEALRKLRAERPDAYVRWFAHGVPVNVLDFDAEADRVRALEVEIAENELRRDYTPSEVRALAGRLKEAGYRDSVGRPKAGEKALGPQLEVVVGKSMKTIRKYLAGEGEGVGGNGVPGPEPESVLVRVLRALTKQRQHIPQGLLEQFDALVHGLEEEAGSPRKGAQ